jgi:maltooligosyltrehalose trehalohydrolase
VGLLGYQFVICVQNHDQIGNRAAGERIGALTSAGRLRIAAALLLCAPFTPMLFQGEEWGASTPFQYFTDHDAELGRAVSAGRRKEFAPFGWDPEQVPDPQAVATFRASKLDWTDLEAGAHADLLDWYRLLLALRRRLPDLSDPRFERTVVTVDDARRTLVVGRGTVLLFVNLGGADVRFALAPGANVLASSDPGVRASDGSIVVPVDAVAIVQVPERSTIDLAGIDLATQGAPRQ